VVLLKFAQLAVVGLEISAPVAVAVPIVIVIAVVIVVVVVLVGFFLLILVVAAIARRIAVDCVRVRPAEQTQQIANGNGRPAVEYHVEDRKGYQLSSARPIQPMPTGEIADGDEVPF
jgi:hypothetical protein